MATVLLNTPNNIQFVNVDTKLKSEDAPTLVVQSGDWDIGDHVEAGIAFDVYGANTPLLTPHDARKLAKWLNKAADILDGVKADKKHKHRHHYEEDEDENY